MSHVEIYTKAFCPYCSRATALLQARGVVYDEYDITMGGPKRAEMIARADGRTTVPQVFIGDVHIGGSDDLAEAEHSGELERLLKAVS